MIMRVSTCFLPVAAVLALVPLVRAQSAPQPAAEAAAGRSIDRVPAARIVRLDAVVTDRGGKPILDLQPTDFEVVENGVVQKIDAVELRRSDGAAPAGAPPIATPDDEVRAAREPGTRVIALLLDEFHVSAGPSSDRVREAVRAFLDEQVRPADLLAVLKPLDPVTDIRFTRDRAPARRAVESFSGRKGDYDARTEFEEKYIGRAPAAVQAARGQIVLSGVRALMSRIGELGSGRAALVFVSEGFVRPAGRTPERRIPDAQGLIRSASRAHVAIYALDPADAADDSGTLLRTMAEQTGGESFVGREGLRAGLQHVARDLDSYYLVSYTSSDPVEGRFYDVQVRARRAGAHVRARTGYWAPVRTELLTGAGRRTPPPRLVRRSPLIETWLGFTVSAEGAPQVIFTWAPAELPARPSRAILLPSAVALKVTTREGAVLYEGEISAPRAGAAVGREDAAFFDAQPGRIQIDLTIFAADGRQMDVAAHDVDLPDVSRADPLILPPQVFRSSSAREFREISRNPQAAPVPGREFRRTERLLLRVPVWSATGAPTTIAARVLNRSGQPLREIAPMPDRADRSTSQFDLPLAWLAPGEYAVEFSAKSSVRTTREVIRFRVTG